MGDRRWAWETGLNLSNSPITEHLSPVPYCLLPIAYCLPTACAVPQQSPAVAGRVVARYNICVTLQMGVNVQHMPTYVYGCDSCGHRFEIFQKFQDAPLVECPECGARIRRIFQPAGIVFKGSGWYSTDSRTTKGESVATGAKSGDGESSGGETATDGKVAKGDEAKGATKTATKSESAAAS